MKTCRDCGVQKPLSEFYCHSAMKDGHLNKCKECVKERVYYHRMRNLEDIREYDRQRGNLPHRVAARKAYQQTDAGKEAMRRANLAYIERNPERRKAHIIVWNAIRNGKLQKAPCEVCGDEKVHAHHDDYSKPLEVRWLCRKHHREAHLR